MSFAFEIRRYSAQDQEKVFGIYHEITQKILTTEGWENRYFLKSCYVLLDETQNMIGWAAIKKPEKGEYGGSGQVRIYLVEKYQNHAIFRFLLKRLIYTAEEMDLELLTANIHKNQAKRLEIYRHQFFKIVGENEGRLFLEHHRHRS